MTRETKIGLLVGLGFIVVFAVLLSHTDKNKEASVAQHLADQMEEQSEFYEPEARDVNDWLSAGAQAREPDESGSADASSGSAAEHEVDPGDLRESPASPTQRRLDRPQRTRTQPRYETDELASIEDVDPFPPGWYHRATRDESESARDEPMSSGSEGTESDSGLDGGTLARNDDLNARRWQDEIPEHRVAPATVIKPEKSDRHSVPVPSEAPDEGLAAGDPGEDIIELTGAEAGSESSRVAPERVPAEQDARVVTEDKSYTVQKGETLGEIASRVYGTVRAVDFLVKVNSETVKDKHNIIEGQTLLTPDWPGADQFEPASHPGVPGNARRTERMITMQNLLDQASSSSGRTAPRAVAQGNAPMNHRPEGPAPLDADLDADRTYVIKPKDTFSSIARSELGSETLWREIQKVNPDLDPKKLQPGMTIQLPATRPWNSMVSSE